MNRGILSLSETDAKSLLPLTKFDPVLQNSFRLVLDSNIQEKRVLITEEQAETLLDMLTPPDQSNLALRTIIMNFLSSIRENNQV